MEFFRLFTYRLICSIFWFEQHDEFEIQNLCSFKSTIVLACDGLKNFL